MNAGEAEAVLSLAKARTPGERHDALRRLHRAAQRLDPAIAAELTTLVNEASSFGTSHALRPMLAGKSKMLSPVAPGPDPFMSEEASATVVEWLECWKAADALCARGLPLAGPMLVHGPPGTGKSTLVASIARRLNPMPTWVLDAHRVVRGHLGETGEGLTQAFHEMSESGALVLEEIDGMGVRRGSAPDASSSEMNRVVIAIMRLLDECRFPVVMTTNRLDVLDPALVRRCEYVVELPEPSMWTRDAILAKELGVRTVPTGLALALPLTTAVSLARRARRLAALHERDACEVMIGLIGVAVGRIGAAS